MFIDRCVGVVVAPVEPIVFQSGNAVQTFSLRWAGRGAALEVPLAVGEGVEKSPVFHFVFRILTGVRLKKEFSVAAVDAADEYAEGFAVRTKG